MWGAVSGQPSSGGGGNVLLMQGGTNTGGGGGGGHSQIPSGVGGHPAGNGGSGIVLLRYPDTFAPAACTFGNVSYVVAGGSKFYAFLSSGNITF